MIDRIDKTITILIGNPFSILVSSSSVKIRQGVTDVLRLLMKPIDGHTTIPSNDLFFDPSTPPSPRLLDPEMTLDPLSPLLYMDSCFLSDSPLHFGESAKLTTSRVAAGGAPEGLEKEFGLFSKKSETDNDQNKQLLQITTAAVYNNKHLLFSVNESAVMFPVIFLMIIPLSGSTIAM